MDVKKSARRFPVLMIIAGVAIVVAAIVLNQLHLIEPDPGFPIKDAGWAPVNVIAFVGFVFMLLGSMSLGKRSSESGTLNKGEDGPSQ